MKKSKIWKWTKRQWGACQYQDLDLRSANYLNTKDRERNQRQLRKELDFKKEKAK